ncbi:MAG: serine hydrolase domain-containing protein [Acidobacteriota bacterium]
MDRDALDLPHTRDEIEAGIECGLHVGAQLAVSVAGRGHATLALGEHAPGQPLDDDTLMIWLSATKPVTAVAVALLWQRGALGLDDPIARHVPEFAAHGKDGITIRHALTHTGGFRLLKTGWPDQSWDEIIATISAARAEPRWRPGAKAGYHLASSWFMLGEVVRRVDGRHPSVFVRDEIFLPLGMDDCYIGMPADRYRDYGARIGRMMNTEVEPSRLHPWHEENQVVGCSPGGNGRGPVRQLLRFYEMLLGGGERDGVRVLSPQTVEALAARHRVGMRDQTFKVKMDWGLGVIVNGAHYDAEHMPYGYGSLASRRTFGHSGYRSSTAFADPEHGLAVALVFAGTPSEAAHTPRQERVVDAIYRDLGLEPS